jgi:prepilin-type N-terminal cleavage/methylation domain-containing protein
MKRVKYMKCNTKQNNSLRRQEARGFTLIEMIGVLAVIAILAALLIPKVFSAINSARVNGVTVNIDTVKTAVVDHYGKYGSFDQLNGTTQLTIPGTGIYTGYDTNVLMIEGLLDKPFVAAISTNATIELCQNSTTLHDNGNAGYQLDGVNIATTNATYVLEAKLMGVTAQDAKDLNDRIDGTSLGSALGSADIKGRVEYAGSFPTTVYIYLTHR